MLADGLTGREADLISSHFSYLQSLRDQGILIFAGRTQNSEESSFGIVIFRAASEAEAIKIMERDPAVKQGLMKAELFPYKVALMETKK
jgi:uncharacterized protein YciI